VKGIVETHVREELERRKDEIEDDVKRSMEKQMLTELEKRSNDEIEKFMAKEVGAAA
jgi:hypothetical protein